MPTNGRLNFQDLLNAVSFAVGDATDERINRPGIINRAGQRLMYAAEPAPFLHGWTWAMREGVPFTIPADKETVGLPDDFGQLVRVDLQPNTGRGVKMVGLSYLNQMRNHVVTPPDTDLWICARVGIDQPGGDAHAPPVMQVFPVQSQARSDVRLTYRVRWRPMSERDPMAVPNIPLEWDHLLELMVRVIAKELIDDTPASQHSETEAIMLELQRLVALDKNKQPTVGRLKRSVRNGNRAPFTRPHGRITGP